jgi:ribosomal protein S6E (S10)
MVATSKIILPYEPGYVANKEADKRRKETKGAAAAARTRICRTATAAVNRAEAV